MSRYERKRTQKQNELEMCVWANTIWLTTCRQTSDEQNWTTKQRATWLIMEQARTRLMQRKCENNYATQQLQKHARVCNENKYNSDETGESGRYDTQATTLLTTTHHVTNNEHKTGEGPTAQSRKMACNTTVSIK